MHANSCAWTESCLHTTSITLQQLVAKFLARPRSFRRHVRPDLDDLEVNSVGEIFIERAVCHMHGVVKENVPVAT
jgi:hypothetical protein